MAKILFFLWLILTIPNPAYCELKPRYGGNLRIAEELLESIRSHPLFELRESGLIPSFPIRYKIDDASAEIDLSFLNPDRLTEIENAVNALQDPSHGCHWILDYPYLNHQHPTSISVEGGKLLIKTTDAETLNVVLSSSCLIPADTGILEPFRTTQFGFEANKSCLGGRPFVDSVSPVVVDPVNPYLSFKLNEVDLISIPEADFQKVSSDPEVTIVPGPKYILYLELNNFTSEQAMALMAAIDPKELARTVLNDHAEILLSRPDSSNTPSSVAKNVVFSFPSDSQYHLIGERIQIQLQDDGFTFVTNGVHSSPILTLRIEPLHEDDFDTFRYQWLRERHVSDNNSRPWSDDWDELESAGRVIPLMIYQSRIAVRNKLQDLRARGTGLPDFANCWILQAL